MIGPDYALRFLLSPARLASAVGGRNAERLALDRISPGKVLLRGPAGTIKLEAKPDANLVHPPTPVAVRPGKTDPSVRPGPELAGALDQPTGMTPTPVGNLSATIPVQTQGYPFLFQRITLGMKQDYLHTITTRTHTVFRLRCSDRVRVSVWLFSPSRHSSWCLSRRCLPWRWISRRQPPLTKLAPRWDGRAR